MRISHRLNGSDKARQAHICDSRHAGRSNGVRGQIMGVSDAKVIELLQHSAEEQRRVQHEAGHVVLVVLKHLVIEEDALLEHGIATIAQEERKQA